jgi:hypothetical protein
MAHCTRVHPLNQCILPILPVDTSRMTAIAPNDNQKPGESTDHGSITTTASNANASTDIMEIERPSHKEMAIAASI